MIFYFSGTGNSRYIAEQLALLLGTDAVSIHNISEDDIIQNISSAEPVGIVSPVYFYGLPTIVCEFISRIDLGGRKVFSVLTYGTTPGNASEEFKKELRRKGTEVKHTFEIKMPENYTPIYDVPDKEEQDLLLADADEYLKDIPQYLEINSYSERRSPAALLLSMLGHPLYKYGRNTRKFKVTEKCTGCAICEKVCPVKAITVSDSRPKWNVGKCVRCVACIHHCPVSAIRLGRSHKHGKYLNPNVTFE